MPLFVQAETVGTRPPSIRQIDYPIYQITTSDVQHVAAEIIGRRLTANELAIIQAKYDTPWWDHVQYLIECHI